MPGIVILVIMLAIFFGTILAVFLPAIKKARDKKTQDEYAAKYRAKNEATQTAKTQQNGLTDEQRHRLDQLREHYKQQMEVDKHERHVEDAHEHGHTGEEEHYEEIVGSLGDINDEGCADLSGVRFIAHDLAYDTSSEEHDYTELAKAMVLGDIINAPRYKKPYSRK